MTNTRSLPLVVLYDATAGVWQRFTQPCEIVATERCGEVMDCLRRVEQIVESRGLYAAGFVSYEAAPAFDRALMVRESAGFPLVWFGLFAKMETVPPPSYDGPDGIASPSYGIWQPSVAAHEYAAIIARLREKIAAGETYQVNYTFRLRRPAAEPWRLFAGLVEAQRAAYATYIETERFAICSASPELFFDLQGSRIAARPMKGTAARGRWPEEDLARAAALAASAKERAENAMIVDMLRNDLGRIARVGSVKVSDLFRVERYPTLWQMTSCVTAETRASLTDIFAATFPCASVTGAPKASTMRIIAQTETSPRRIYTGSIGLIAPGRRARFNVAIRTVLIEKDRQQAEYGVGGGVVWDSTAEGEYKECLLKARILTARQPEFSLLESFLWTPSVGQVASLPEIRQIGNLPHNGGYWLLDEHLHRLQQSAEYFGVPLDMTGASAALNSLAASLPPQPHKIRLLVDRSGRITTEAAALDDRDFKQPVRLELAAHPVDATDVFLFHKTTHRKVYDDARAGCVEGDDVLLYNCQGEATETCRANIAVRIGEDLWTPPVSCGLLAGTYRARLLAEGQLRERVIPLEMLASCDELFSLNSVRGMHRACLVGLWQPRDIAASGRVHR
jgi:para-aminobenzoate synthetase / 4-amino-4-deoxychorismate lyase